MTKLDVDKGDAIAITQQNKVLRCIYSCKATHGGLLTTEDELMTLTNDEKSLNAALNLEIRLRRLTLDRVKP